MQNFDVVIIGAGAAGLMCAIEAGKRGRKAALLDHSRKVGEKIRISGGGRCNFTNIHATHENFLSQNPNFCRSALQRYTPRDFIDLVERHDIAYYEKTLGQLFCEESANLVILMLLNECKKAGVEVFLECNIDDIIKPGDDYHIASNQGTFICPSLVMASGGKSIPKMGATGFSYDIARQFGHSIIDPVAALVPFTYKEADLEMLQGLSGISLDAVVKCGKKSFSEALLFTHRGLSGPVILQISSYWVQNQEIIVNLAPGTDVFEFLKTAKSERPKQAIHNILAEVIPKRLAQALSEKHKASGRIGEMGDKLLRKLSQNVNDWRFVPNGTEGFRTAEVTKGGINTRELSSKTMESNLSDGLYFIGEAVDVTGHLGGYNFQWAWASGHAAGQFA